MEYDAFISYAGTDKKIAKDLANFLKALGLDVFIFEEKRKYGMELTKKISDAISTSKLIFVLFTRDGLSSQWVNQEVGFAYALNKEIIAIVEKYKRVSGFIGYHEHISLERSDHGWWRARFEIFKLIKDKFRLRGIKLECPFCYNRMRVPIPSEDELRKYQRRNSNFEIQCNSCKELFYMGRLSFKVYKKR